MLVLVRMSPELMIKSDRVRTRFQKKLVKNIKAALSSELLCTSNLNEGVKVFEKNVSESSPFPAPVTETETGVLPSNDDFVVSDSGHKAAKRKPFRVRSQWARIYIEFDDPIGLEVLKRVFGIHSVSVIENQCESTLDEIVKVGVKTFGPQILDGETFGVKAKRAGKQIPFTSIDVNVQLGRALNIGIDRVDLTNPDKLFYVEVRPEKTFFYSASIKGAGGLPLGTAGHAVCLLSGGFDSPAAAWMMMRRGITLDFVLCNMAGKAFERSVLEIARVLAKRWAYGNRPKFYAVDYELVVADLKSSVEGKYLQVILKRLFYRTAEKIAERVGGEAIITGEAVAQVSSQTLQNLRAIDDVSSIPVFRPLIAFDKEDIISMCRDIGTHDLSCKIQEFCQLVPTKPATACSVKKARAEEERTDRHLVVVSAERAKVFDLRKLSKADLAASYVSVGHVPQGATVIDCREQQYFESWHFTDAINVEFFRLLDGFKKMDKAKTYLIYCPVGMQSILVAEKMQSEGYLAYSFEGGVNPLMQWEKQSKT